MTDKPTPITEDARKPPKLPFLYRAARFCVDESDVTISWPGELSAGSVEYIEEYLLLVLRGMKRRASVTHD